MGRTSAGDRGHWAGKNDARFRFNTLALRTTFGGITSQSEEMATWVVHTLPKPVVVVTNFSQGIDMTFHGIPMDKYYYAMRITGLRDLPDCPSFHAMMAEYPSPPHVVFFSEVRAREPNNPFVIGAFYPGGPLDLAAVFELRRRYPFADPLELLMPDSLFPFAGPADLIGHVALTRNLFQVAIYARYQGYVLRSYHPSKADPCNPP